MKRKLVRFLVASTAVLIIAVFGDYLYEEPQVAPARAIFHVGYRLTGGSDRFLTSYSQHLLETNGGTIPFEVDTYLCSRLQSTSSTSEFDALVHFYILQSNGRMGIQLGRLPDELKARVIDEIFQRITSLDRPDCLKAIELVEYLRLDGDIFKPHLSRGELRNKDGISTTMPEAIDEAVTRFADWWRSPFPWPEKKKISPLEGSNLSIIGFP